MIAKIRAQRQALDMSLRDIRK